MDRQCVVLAAQVQRARGGEVVYDYDTFAAALDDLVQNAGAWQARGASGRAYVEQRYTCRDAYVGRVLGAITQLRVPLREQMRQRGLARAARGERAAWRLAFGRLVDELLEAPARPYREDIGIQPYHAECRVAWGTRTALVPLRLFNWGSHAAAAEGPGRTLLYYEVSELRSGQAVIPRRSAELSALLLPGHAQTAVVSLAIPPQPGQYRIALWAARESAAPGVPDYRLHLPLTVEARGAVGSPSCTTTLLGDLQRSLPEIKRLQQLPDDYSDFSEGLLGRWKCLVKKKLLNNFKQGYLDVLSRQQSRLNAHLVLAVQQLGECCAALDHAVRGLQQRLDQIEAKLDDFASDDDPAQVEPLELSERERA